MTLQMNYQEKYEQGLEQGVEQKKKESTLRMIKSRYPKRLEGLS